MSAAATGDLIELPLGSLEHLLEESSPMMGEVMLLDRIEDVVDAFLDFLGGHSRFSNQEVLALEVEGEDLTWLDALDVPEALELLWRRLLEHDHDVPEVLVGNSQSISLRT